MKIKFFPKTTQGNLSIIIILLAFLVLLVSKEKIIELLLAAGTIPCPSEKEEAEIRRFGLVFFIFFAIPSIMGLISLIKLRDFSVFMVFIIIFGLLCSFIFYEISQMKWDHNLDLMASNVEKTTTVMNI